MPLGFPDDTNNKDILPVDVSEQAGAGHTLLEEFLQSAAYTSVQVPAEGLTQLASAGSLQAPKLINRPREVKFGTAEWHAQALGSGAGMVLTFLGTRKALGWGINKMAAPELAPKYIAGLNKPAGLAATGFVMDSVLKPGSPDDILRTRFSNGTAGALSLYTMGRVSQLMTRRSLLLANTEKLSFSKNLGIQTVSGGIGGFTHAQAESLLAGKGLAPVDKSLQSTYAGGLLGLSLSLQPRGGPGQARPAEANNKTQVSKVEVNKTEVDKAGSSLTVAPNNTETALNPAGSKVQGVQDVLETNPWRAGRQVSEPVSEPSKNKAESPDVSSLRAEKAAADIAIHKEFPGGGSFTVKKDGTVIDVAADGSQRISRPDGSVITIDLNGKTIKNKDGSIVQVSPDGTITEYLHNGMAVRRHTDGSSSTTFQNESTQNIPGLGRFTRKADGSYSIELSPDKPAESPEQLPARGTNIDYTASGLKTRETSTGELTVEGLEDGVTTLFPDGSWVTRKADGTQFIFLPKENIIEEIAPDGTIRGRHNLNPQTEKPEQEPPKNEPWWKYFDPPN